MIMIDIKDRREFFWDDFLIDKERTSAKPKLHRLTDKEIVIEHDSPWESGDTIYYNIVKDDGLYRMYYLANRYMGYKKEIKFENSPMVVCCAISTDGIKWEKPDFGICEFEGSKNNNIILDHRSGDFDNFFVFKDTNPGCPDNEKFKGIGRPARNPAELWCFVSADGIDFQKAWMMTDKGKFDTLNTAFWDVHKNKYFCYIRDFHNGIRDIRYMISDDFKTWTDPVLLDFGSGDDYPLYTNVISPYYRGDHIYTGFPSRYVERKEWSANFDQLSNPGYRKVLIELLPRLGLATTDCVFMTSRDGIRWNRFDEAFMTPGPEHMYNWVYGDCYPALGMIETPQEPPCNDTEISMYVFENHFFPVTSKLRRYTIRKDGFVSYNSGYKQSALITKPFVFTGKRMSLNFSTSAIGWIKIKVRCGGKELESVELFGDNTDRTVYFKEGDISEFSRRTVIMEMTMSDADVFSFKMDNKL
jgi:hypothetical protein